MMPSGFWSKSQGGVSGGGWGNGKKVMILTNERHTKTRLLAIPAF